MKDEREDPTAYQERSKRTRATPVSTEIDRLALRYRRVARDRFRVGVLDEERVFDLIGYLAAIVQLGKRKAKKDLGIQIALREERVLRAEHADIVQQALPAQARREVATRGALAKLERDSNGKQAAKRAIKERWLAWQRNEGERYRSGAEFAGKMVDAYDKIIKNPKTVENWVRAWREEIAARRRGR